MRRLLTFAATVVLAGIALVPAATAEKPIRTLAPTPEPFVLEGPCAFDVRLEVLTNKEVGTAFSDGRFLVTGSYKVRLTNLDPGGGSIDVNISGPGDFTPTEDGGFTLNARGNWLFWFFPGDLGITSGRLLLTSGHTTEVLDAAFTPVSFTPSRNVTDACALLA